MIEIVDAQKLVDRIKALRGLHSDKDVAVLLGLAPADFSNRKKRNTLTPLVVEWALREDLDLNMLFKGTESETGQCDKESVRPRPVHAMINSRGAKEWLSEDPVERIVLQEAYVHGVELVRMCGSGMEPTIRDGAIFAVDRNVAAFSSGQVFVVWMPIDGPVVRRAFIDLGKLILKSDNQVYPDIVIPIAEIPQDGFVLGMVRWVLQML